MRERDIQPDLYNEPRPNRLKTQPENEPYLPGFEPKLPPKRLKRKTKANFSNEPNRQIATPKLRELSDKGQQIERDLED